MTSAKIEALRSEQTDKDALSILQLVVVSLQHAALALVFLVYPLSVARLIGLSETDTTILITGTLFAGALSTLIHYFKPPWGSGSLAIEIPTPVYIPVLVIAGSQGGLPLIAAVVVMCGIVEFIFARNFRYLKKLFPPEICGIALIMLGVSIGRPAAIDVIGSAGSQDGVLPLIITMGTLFSMFAVSVYGTRNFKLYTLVIGAFIGLALSSFLGVWGEDAINQIGTHSLLGLPHLGFTIPAFDPSILPLAIILGFAVAIDNLGVLINVQRQRDPDWKKIDPVHSAAGVQTSAIGDFIAGFVGGMPTGVSSSNVGLAYATQVSHRLVSLIVGCVLLAALFSPKIIVFMSSIPGPVVSAVVIFSACYMLVSGMELLFTRLINERRIFTIGLSLVAGFAPDAFVMLIEKGDIPLVIQPILHSQMATALIIAIVLNLAFQIGVSKTASFVIEGDDNDDFQSLEQFLKRIGKDWAMRRSVIENALRSGSDLLEALSMMGFRTQPVMISANHTDDRFELSISYVGPEVEFPKEVAPLDDLEGDRRALARYAVYLASRVPDEIKQKNSKDRSLITLRFDN